MLAEAGLAWFVAGAIVIIHHRRIDAGVSDVDRRIALFNIAHFKERLGEIEDETERRRVTALLKEEEAKLAAIMERRRLGEDGPI